MSKIFVANWKSNKTLDEAQSWLSGFDASQIPAVAEVIIAPSFQLLSTAKENIQSPLKLAAQDVSSFPMGSYTGAVNAQQLKDLGAEYVIVGHSERRKYFHETHTYVAAKIEQAVANNLKPILCLDEEYIENQAAALSSTDIPGLIIAYEPLSAIGTGNNAPADQVTAVVAKIKQVYGDVPVLYGGSVDERSVREYLLISDGVLVGGASLQPDSFQKVVAAAAIE